MLKIENLSAGYGEAQVLSGLDLHINAGEVVALMGRNGMGKTTLTRAIMGTCRTFVGNIIFNGQEISSLKPYQRARRGIGLVPEGRGVFPNLSVRENLSATARDAGVDGWDLAKIFDLFPRLAERESQYGRTLSGGEQQMLAIGRALLTNPQLLVLDEATEGLAPVVREEVWRCLEQEIKPTGQAILLIDKYPKRIAAISNYNLMLEKGKIVWEGDCEQLLADEDIQHKYLGV
jgi:branched-chain amino acid transport system ATP-binding protein